MISGLSPDEVDRLLSHVTVAGVGDAVRELLQNSVDAGATHAEVKVDLGTLSVLVSDDGLGIKAADFAWLGRRHYTSKHHGASHGGYNGLFGHRGEALAALAAVGSVTVHSGGNWWNEHRPTGFLEIDERKATTVVCRGLFSSLPVRRQAVLSAGTKVLHEVREAVLDSLVKDRATAVDVWVCDNNKKSSRLAHVDRHGDVATLVRQVFGHGLSTPVNASFDGHRLDGVVGHGPRPFHYVYVDGLRTEVSAADRRVIAPYNECFLMDVRTCRHDPGVVRPMMTKVFEAVAEVSPRKRTLRLPSISPTKRKPPAPAPVVSGLVPREALATGRVIGQFDNSFLVVEAKGHLFVVDQHACDERIQLEHLMEVYVAGLGFDTSVAIPPQRAEVSAHDAELLRRYQPQLARFGIHYVVGAKTLTVTHAPVREPIPGIFQYVDDLDAGRKTSAVAGDWWRAMRDVPQMVVEMLAGRACRSAVRLGTALSAHEAHQLVRALARCRSPFQCAHGRPLVVPLARGVSTIGQVTQLEKALPSSN